MAYRLSDFIEQGLYIEKPDAEECELDGGQVISEPDISETIREMLRTTGGSTHGGDSSRQDSAVITALLSAGYNPNDVYKTFISSVRGRDAAERKPGHLEDYVRRTVQKAVGFLSASKTNSHIGVNFSKTRSANVTSGLVISMGNEVEVERTNWIWPGYIPAGKLTLIAGDPGMGKSTIVSDLIARISKGTFLPSGVRSVTGTSLICSAEDSAEDTIIPRLIASEANLRKVGIIREVKETDEVGEGESRFVSLPRDLKILKQGLAAKGCRVLIIDPLNAFLEKGTDTYKDQDMRRVLHPMEQIAEETGTAIVVVAHLTKKEDTSTLYRVGGSIGFIGAARSVLAVTTMPDETRVLYSLKSNLSARPPSLSYEIKQVRKQRTESNTWLGEGTVNSTTIRWLGEVDFNPFAKVQSPVANDRVNQEAQDFLQQVLQDAGEVETDILYREAKIAGLSKAHLNRVKTTLGVRAIRRSGTWYWAWPTEP